MSFWRTKNSKKITSDSIAVKTDGTTLKDYLTETQVTTLGDSKWGCIYKRKGNVVELQMCNHQSITLSGYAHNNIGTLPSALIPALGVALNVPVFSLNKNNVYLYVGTNGNVSLYNWGGAQTFEGYTLRAHISYLI